MFRIGLEHFAIAGNNMSAFPITCCGHDNKLRLCADNIRGNTGVQIESDVIFLINNVS